MAEFRLASRLTAHDLTEFSENARQAVASASSISINALAVCQIDALGLQAITSLARLASQLDLADREQAGRSVTGCDVTETFRLEAGELLEALEQNLLDLVSDPSSTDLPDSAFRGLHTIKGSGAMYGFAAIADFVHAFETAFGHIRKGRRSNWRSSPTRSSRSSNGKITRWAVRPPPECAGGPNSCVRSPARAINSSSFPASRASSMRLKTPGSSDERAYQ